MRIQHNIAALNSHRNLTNNNSSVSKNLEKLSSGYRINRAGDDAAGLAISEKMRAQITGLQTAQKNAEDGIGLVQTAEGALTEVHSMLNRMVELATQSANGTYDAKNRLEMQKEVDQLREEIDRISNTANFNGKMLFKADGETTSGATKVGITGGTVAANFVDGGAGPAKNTLDLSGVSFANDGTVNVNFAGNDFEIEVTKDMTATDLAKKIADAYNALDTSKKIGADTGAGAFTVAASGGKITITGTNNAAIADDDIEALVSGGIKISEVTQGNEAPAAGGEGTKVGITNDTFTVNTKTVGAANATAVYEIDLAAKAPVFANDGAVNVTLGGKTFEIEVVKGMSATDFATAVAAAANNQITDSIGGKFAVTASNGKLTITASGDAVETTNIKDDFKIAELPEEETNNDREIRPRDTTQEKVDVVLHVGESVEDANSITVSIEAMNSETLGSDEMSIKTLNILNEENAKTSINAAKEAIDQVSSIRSTLGAMQNRLEHTINNLGVQTENITAAESRIRDVDMAKEMMTYTKNNILVQASQAMLAQANQVPQGVLQLLQ